MFEKIEERLTADEFLESLIDEGTATVPTKELRSLLQKHRILVDANKDLKKKHEFLKESNTNLRLELANAKMGVLCVTGIDKYF